MIPQLKKHKDWWNELHQVGWTFYESLPEETKQAFFQKLTTIFNETSANRLLEFSARNREISTGVLTYLIDFLPIEQAITLYRYEIWGYFSHKSLESTSLSVSYIDYADFVDTIQKIDAKSLIFNIFTTQKFTQEDLYYLFEVEKYVLLLHLRQEAKGLLNDLEFIVRYYKNISLSTEHALYTLGFSKIEIEIIHEWSNKTNQEASEMEEEGSAEKAIKYLHFFYKKNY
jgi:hypothetical protein